MHLELSKDEAELLAGLVRAGLRRRERTAAALAERHGEDFDPSVSDAKVAMLESLYERLGKDPARITNRARGRERDEDVL